MTPPTGRRNIINRQRRTRATDLPHPERPSNSAKGHEPLTADRDAGAAGRAAAAAGSPGGVESRERFVLDSAHVGDIQGAFGTIRQTSRPTTDSARGRWRCLRSSGRD